VTFPEYSAHVADVYRKDYASIKDPEQHAAAFQPIWDYVNSAELVDDPNNVAVKSVVSVMNSAKDQFTNLVRNFYNSFICLVSMFLQAASYHNLDEIEVVGVMVYTGTDAAGHQMSTIFGGSTVVQRILSDSRSDVRKIIDRITTEIK
jgi:hypothetical protein